MIRVNIAVSFSYYREENKFKIKRFIKDYNTDTNIYNININM